MIYCLILLVELSPKKHLALGMAMLSAGRLIHAGCSTVGRLNCSTAYPYHRWTMFMRPDLQDIVAMVPGACTLACNVSFPAVHVQWSDSRTAPTLLLFRQ